MNKDDIYPASTKRVYFRTHFMQDEETGDWEAGWHYGFYLKDANKYVKGVHRWKDLDRHKWYDDKDVIEWMEIKEQEHEQGDKSNL